MLIRVKEIAKYLPETLFELAEKVKLIQDARLYVVGGAIRDLLLGKKVFLRLWVKVKSHWTDDERLLKDLGYE